MEMLLNKLSVSFSRKKFSMTLQPYGSGTKISQAKFFLVDWTMRFKSSIIWLNVVLLLLFPYFLCFWQDFHDECKFYANEPCPLFQMVSLVLNFRLCCYMSNRHKLESENLKQPMMLRKSCLGSLMVDLKGTTA